tara:strand:- start:1679 stop:1996 length:318 start_codon:yes stop_codon:yes gene_type:complete
MKLQRASIYRYDATSKKDMSNISFNFDFIIDDGSHLIEHQLKSLSILAKRLKPDGVYIIEDIQNLKKEFTLFQELADKLKLSLEVIDRRKIKNRFDDVMIILKNC